MTKPTVWLASDLDAQAPGPWVHALRLSLALGGQLTIAHAHDKAEHDPWRKLPSPAQQLRDWGHEGASDVHLVSLQGKPHFVLPGAFRARRPDWLVLGTHRPTGTKRLFAGSLGEYLARSNGPTKTLVVPAGVRSFVAEGTGRFELARVLVAVGGDPDQQSAIDAAAGLADVSGHDRVEFVVLHCGSEATMPQLSYPERPNWTWRREIVPSEDVVRAIVEGGIRWKARVVVMQSHGHDSLSDWLFGSHAERVIRSAVVPIVTVRSS